MKIISNLKNTFPSFPKLKFGQYRARIFKNKPMLFFSEVKEWVGFLYYYTKKRFLFLAVYFEKIKDLLVGVLVAKRGRYSRHFLNLSFLFLVGGALAVGPVIADYYPTVRKDEHATQEGTDSGVNSISLDDFNTATSESKKNRFEIIDYEVVKGDTLGSIADKFGISIDTIRWANSLKTDTLVPGQTLSIPPVTGIVHKVQSGDTVYSVAKKYKSDAQKIVDFPANDFADLDTFALNVGQTLFIPDGVMPDAAPIFRPQQLPVPQFIAGSGGKFMWPTVGVITQYPSSYHMAVDIANNALPPVAAGDDGVVSYAGCIPYGYGCHVIINHADGFQTLYGHLSQIYAKVGDQPKRGQVIGKMGSTGRSTGPHTHFEVRKNGVLLNPLSYLK